VACLDHSLTGLAASTAFLQLLLVLGYTRVALCLPRAAFHATWAGCTSLVAAALFGALALLPGAEARPPPTHHYHDHHHPTPPSARLVVCSQAYERAVLYVNLLIEPCSLVLFVATTWHDKTRGKNRDGASTAHRTRSLHSRSLARARPAC